MELRQLEYLVAIAEEGNFTRAAARVHVTQPGLSAQIAVLERELGQTLFHRGRHGAALTETGHAVLAHARDALAATIRIRTTADEYAGLLRGEVRLGFVSGAANSEFDIPRILAAFRHDHPQVRVSLSEDGSEAMTAALVSGDLDIAIIGLTGAELPPGVSTDIVLDTAVVAAVAADDTHLPQRQITLERLAREPLICLSPGTGIRGAFQRACDAAGLAPDIAYEAAAPPLLIRLAAHGLGVAIVPEPSPDEAATGVRILRIVKPSLRGQLALAAGRSQDQTPATKVLLGQLRIALKR